MRPFPVSRSVTPRLPFLNHNLTQGPSIKYVTLFLANFYPLFPVTLCHTSRTPTIFSMPSTKNQDKSPLYKFSLNCSRGFLSGSFVRGSFVWKVLSGVAFVRLPFCQNTSVTTEC